MNWNPIESAPKDGTHILLRVKHPRYGVFITEGHGRPIGGGNTSWEAVWGGFMYYEGSHAKTRVTHWMPLPEEPKE